MDDVNNAILNGLSSDSVLDRNNEYKVHFDLNWNPLEYWKEQEYKEKPEDALESAITITGSITDAQALTTIGYLAQIWPDTGEYVMSLLKQLLCTPKEDFVPEVTAKCIVPPPFPSAPSLCTPMSFLLFFHLSDETKAR
jgi:hypothetical protein